jgi:hypothetical protein
LDRPEADRIFSRVAQDPFGQLGEKAWESAMRMGLQQFCEVMEEFRNPGRALLGERGMFPHQSDPR